MLKEKQQQKGAGKHHEADQVIVNYYTDPLCCWSWAFEKHWQQLRKDFGHILQFRYVMAGMIPDWNSYNDPINSISRPLQMGPLWMHASCITGVKMKYAIWHEDPPASSFPACIAVKCAGMQSKMAEEQLLHCLRKSLFEEGLNISRREIIFSIAKKLEKEIPENFNLGVFKNDWKNGTGKNAFREDFQKLKYYNIGRYPTLTFQKTGGKGVMIIGYRPYDVLLKALEQVHPGAVKFKNKTHSESREV